MNIFNKTQHKQRRQELRYNMTEPEKRLWQILRNKQMGIKFRRQHGISHYIVDFYCPELRKRDTQLGEYVGTNCPHVAMQSATGKLRKTLAGKKQYAKNAYCKFRQVCHFLFSGRHHSRWLPC